MAVADRICKAFDEAGITYFIDRQGIGGGFEFPEVLANAIVECKVVLYLASKNSYVSKFTNAQMTFAFNEKSKNSILPYIIDGSTMPPALRFVFAGVNWRNIKDHPIETTLVADILRMLGREAKQPKPTPPRPPRKPSNFAPLKRVLIAVAALLCIVGAVVGTVSYVKERPRLSGKGNNGVYDIGYYYDDGKKKGVVFEVTADGKHGKIVSLTESSEIMWASDENEQKRLIGADDEYNGANNMAKVMQIEGWHNKYPAFAWCADLGEGWYLPAIEEWNKFMFNDAIHNAVNRTLETKGKVLANQGDSHWYWSSTEYNEFCAWLVLMYLGNTYSDLKYRSDYVRAVSAF
jgi:hypothetical protein